MSATELRIPLLNANERDAQLVDIYVDEGAAVSAGDRLYTLETTKSTADVTAESDGFVRGLQAAVGQQVSAGDLFGYLADSADWQPPAKAANADTGSKAAPSDIRITRPARALAEAHDIDITKLPTGSLITENVLRDILKAEDSKAAEPASFDDDALVIYGGGGHGKSLIELVRAMQRYRIVGIIDDAQQAGKHILGVPVLGGGDHLDVLYGDGVHLAVNAVGGIGDVNTRIRVFERIRGARFLNPVVTHPTAFIEASAELAEGTQVFPLAYVGSEVRTGFGSIINTGAIVSHDCILGQYTNIAPGAILAGGVQVRAGTLIGMGVTINLNVIVGEGCLIGNGATVKADVPDGTIIRAGSIWPR